MKGSSHGPFQHHLARPWPGTIDRWTRYGRSRRRVVRGQRRGGCLRCGRPASVRDHRHQWRCGCLARASRRRR